MATSRVIRKKTPISFKKQEGGLIEYGDGGAVLGAATGVLGAVAPWAGMAVNLLTSVIGNKKQADEETLARQQAAIKTQGAAQGAVNNPFQPVFAMGGEVGDPDYTGLAQGFIKQNYRDNPSYNPSVSRKVRNSASGNIRITPYLPVKKEQVKEEPVDNTTEIQKDYIRERVKLQLKYPKQEKFGGIPREEYLDFAARGIINQRYKSTPDKIKGIAIDAGLAVLPELMLGKGVPALTKLLKPNNPLLKGEKVLGTLRNGTKVKAAKYSPYVEDGFAINQPTNQLAAPPSEIRIPGVGGTEAFNPDLAMRYAIQTNESYPGINVMDGLQTRFPNASRRELEEVYNRARNASPQFAATTWPNGGNEYKQVVRNQSSLTKEDLLKNPSLKDKESVSKMTEEQFSNTVLKPNGEVAYYANPNSFKTKLPHDQNWGMPIIDDATPLTHTQYVEKFNSNIDNLNKIIAKNNKTGIPYSVDKLTTSGQLQFKPNVISESSMEGSAFPAMGSRWSVNINPGEWKGTVKDIAHKEYYKSIPGLEMSNTSGSVFNDGVARTGSGAYKSINEYLKSLDLGRVKPGFNSQTNYSRAAWEKAVTKGDAVGHYSSPNTVYGVMKSLLPAAIVGEGVNAMSREYAAGGYVPNMQPNIEVEGGEVIQGKDGSTAKVIGPKHKDGGVKLFMENGGRVFSDKIINPETGRTFAEDADRLRKMMK